MAAAGEPGVAGPGSGALVSKDDPGAGILVDSRGGRPIGDTNTSAVYVTDLPKNFIGGDEALHFALGELFGQFGKIKKIELYMEDGMLDTKIFKGEALVVYHTTKKTGTRDAGDPVWDACTDLDGQWRLLGKRGWRIRCEAAAWQRQGFDVKLKAKTYPCVEIANLWDYDPSLPMSWFAQIQEEIRKHCIEHVSNPFVKVEPSAGTATIWTKGAQDAMKLGNMMHKSFFMGRKIVASLCRKEKPINEDLPRLPTGELTMQLPTHVWDGSGPLPGAAGPHFVPQTDGAELPDAFGPGSMPPEEAMQGPTLPPGVVEAFGPAAPSAASSAAAPTVAAAGPAGEVLQKGRKVVIKGLQSKPENNGKRAKIVSYADDLGKYQVVIEGDCRVVKIKPENLEALLVEEALTKAERKRRAAAAASAAAGGGEDDDEDDEKNADRAEAQAAATLAGKMASGDVKAVDPMAYDPKRDGFLPTVCVDPSLLPRKEGQEEEAPKETEITRRERSRSRERRMQERVAAAKARLEADKGPRPAWVMPSPDELAAKAAAAGGGTGAAAARVPEESREELMKLSVGKLKELLKQFGKSARGCLEKRDFVDRLKPAPKE